MFLSKLSVKRPVTILMVVLIILLFGVLSFTNLGIDMMPDMNLPIVAVMTTYTGAGPEEIENRVTTMLESALASVSNVESITSTSSDGTSTILVQFSWGTDIEYAALKIRENIDLIKGYLPTDAGTPMVVQFDPSLLPVATYSVTADLNTAELTKLAEETIKPRLERIEGVASVSISGGYDRAIRVYLNEQKMHGYGLSTSTVSQMLAAQNLNSGAGTMDDSGLNYILKTQGEFGSVEEIENLTLTTPTGGQVKISDIGRVVDGFTDVTSYSFLDGRQTISLSVQKQSGSNTVLVANKVKEEMAAMERELYGNLTSINVMDQAQFIELAISTVFSSAILGALLAVLIIYAFLRSISSTLIIGISIPISVIATFILIHFAGLTINMMTLGGLALGVGMLVDNSIVVLESIFKKRQGGMESKEAAVYGAKEVATAISASTLTTLAVFLPITLLSGLASQIFRELALTVAFSLISSLVVALSLVPMLASKLMASPRSVKVMKKIDGKDGKKEERGLYHKYGNALDWSLRHRKSVMAILLVVVLAAVAMIPFMGTEFIPTMESGSINVNIEMPNGTSLEKTREATESLEDIIRAYPEVDYIYSSIGSNSTNTSSLVVNLVPSSERDRSEQECIDMLREATEDVPDVKLSFSGGFSMTMGGSAISITVSGRDLDTLQALGQEVMSVVDSVKGTTEVNFSMAEGQPEYDIVVDKEKASLYGLTSAQIATMVKTSLSGSTATIYRENGSEIDVIVQSEESSVKELKDIASIQLMTPTGVTIPLSQVARFEKGFGPMSIQHTNQERSATITASITEDVDLGTVTSEIEQRIEQEVNFPSGYSISYEGEQQNMMDSFSDLGYALIIAVVLVYMVMAAQFESLIQPFIVLFSMPLAMVGVTVGLMVTGRNFGITAFIGIIMLAGIVVNNAIVLVDYINQLKQRVYSTHDAIVEAGRVRLRPILMTALTTILGMLPMAIGVGEGSELQAPLAVSVVGGLFTSTFLTLFIIPVIYSLVDGVLVKIKKKFKRTKNKVSEPAIIEE